MKVKPVLRDLSIGADVAENDAQLENYFVETSTFWDVVGDTVDVVLGPKGSGKSAISRRLADSDVSIDELDDVDIVPAFNLQGSVFFRRLASEIAQVEENEMRVAWTAYIVGLIGNHILSNYEDSIDCTRIRKFLTDTGFLFLENRPRSIWSHIVGLLRKARPSKIEGALTVDQTGLPRIEASAEFDNETPAAQALAGTVDWEILLEAELRVLELLGRRCWLLFDRLDEAFPYDRDLERVALRALLRAHLDVCSYGVLIRTKLFLRTDLLDRITAKEGFVNATHLRSHRISWDHKTLIDMVARRIIESESIRDTFNLDRSQLSSESGRLAIYRTVVPAIIESQDVFGWIVQRTTDATGEPNPRNVLSLLREARSRQLQICDRDDPDIRDGGPLIRTPAMQQALRALSTIRLEDTLYAEFNHMRPWIEKLRGRFVDYAPTELANALGIDVNSDTFASVVADFKYSGFMRESPNKRLSIPILYRASLGIQEGRPRQKKSAGRARATTGGQTDKLPATKETTTRTERKVAHVDLNREREDDRVAQCLTAHRVQYLTADEYRMFFEIFTEEVNKGYTATGELARVVRDRCVTEGLVLNRYAINHLAFSLPVLRRQGKLDSYRPEDFAEVYFFRIVRMLQASYVDLMPEEREALAFRIVGKSV